MIIQASSLAKTVEAHRHLSTGTVGGRGCMRGWGRHFRSPQTPQSSTEGGPVSILLLQEEILVIHPYDFPQLLSKK